MISVHFEHEKTKMDGNDITDFIGGLAWRLPSEAKLYFPIHPDLRYIETPEPMGGGEPAVELLVAFSGMAGGIITAVITAIYQSIQKYMERNANREITLEKDGQLITLKGHSLPEMKELLQLLYPEALSLPTKPIPSRLEKISKDARIRLKAPNETENPLNTTSTENHETFPKNKSDYS